MFNPVFHVPLLNPEHFYDELFLFEFIALIGEVLKIKLVRPLLHGARTDCGSEREHGLIFETFSQCNTCSCLLTFSSY